MKRIKRVIRNIGVLFTAILLCSGIAFGAGANPVHQITAAPMNIGPTFIEFNGGWEPAGGMSHTAPENPWYKVTSIAFSAPSFRVKVEITKDLHGGSTQPYIYILGEDKSVMAQGYTNANTWVTINTAHTDSNTYQFYIVVATSGSHGWHDYKVTLEDNIHGQQTDTHIDPTILIYETSNYAGDFLRVTAPEYIASSSWNDKISSMRIPKGVYVKAYEHNKTGKRRTYYRNTPYVGSLMNDEISCLVFGMFNFKDFFMAFQSDTQVEWTAQEVRPHSTQGQWEIDNGLSEEEASELYNRNISKAINYIDSHLGGGRLAGVVINGDLTEFGNQDNDLNQFKSYCIDPLNVNAYPGLGNHDYEKPVDDCGTQGTFTWNSCTADMIEYMRSYIKTIPTVRVATDSQWYHGIRGTQIHAGIDYSWQVGNMHFVQMNNYPGYNLTFRSEEWGIGGKDYTINSGNWFNEDLTLADGFGLKTIVNMHQARRVANPNVSAMFSGHSHSQAKTRVMAGTQYIDNYRSGSSDNGNFLIARFVDDTWLYIWKMHVDWMRNGELQVIPPGGPSIDIDTISTPFSITGQTYYTWKQRL